MAKREVHGGFIHFVGFSTNATVAECSSHKRASHDTSGDIIRQVNKVGLYTTRVSCIICYQPMRTPMPNMIRQRNIISRTVRFSHLYIQNRQKCQKNKSRYSVIVSQNSVSVSTPPELTIFLSSLHFSLPTHPPTIHRDNLARDIATGTTSQEDHHALEVFWLTPPAGRNTCHDTGVPALVIDQCLVHVRGNVSRSNGVDIDTLGYPLVRQSLGELAHTTLGRGVGGHGDTTLESQERGNVNDGTPAAGGELGCVTG